MSVPNVIPVKAGTMDSYKYSNRRINDTHDRWTFSELLVDLKQQTVLAAS